VPEPGDSIDVFNAWHQHWVEYNVAALQAEGYTAVTQVGFFDATRGTYAVLDIVASFGGVPQFGMEIKTLAFDPGIGTPNIDALYTPNQQIVYPQIRAGTAIPVGANAANAGFVTDQPIGPPGFGIIDVVIGGRGLH
jgi:hypothetical protein